MAFVCTIAKKSFFSSLSVFSHSTEKKLLFAPNTKITILVLLSSFFVQFLKQSTLNFVGEIHFNTPGTARKDSVALFCLSHPNIHNSNVPKIMRARYLSAKFALLARRYERRKQSKYLLLFFAVPASFQTRSLAFKD